MKTGEIHFSNCRASASRPRRRAGLLAATGAIALLAATAMPITVDTPNGLPAIKAAFAGSENGNGDGQGRGEGNGKGQGDENGGGGGGGKGAPDDVFVEEEPDTEDGSDSALGMADSHAVEAVGETPATGPVGTPAAGLPTIKQIFAMGDDAVLSAEAELEAIKNGWGGGGS